MPHWYWERSIVDYFFKYVIIIIFSPTLQTADKLLIQTWPASQFLYAPSCNLNKQLPACESLNVFSQASSLFFLFASTFTISCYQLFYPCSFRLLLHSVICLTILSTFQLSDIKDVKVIVNADKTYNMDSRVIKIILNMKWLRSKSSWLMS
jgi:hypothetical protein